MADELNKLIEAFKMKEENEKFLKNLENLKADGSIDQDVYPSMKDEYQQRLNSSVSQIETIKDGLRQQLEKIQHDQDSSKYELKKLEARYKAGELPSTDYEKSNRAIRNKIDVMEQQAEELRGLIIAESVSELETPVEKPAEAKPAPATKPQKFKLPSIKLPERKKLMYFGGGAVALIVIILLIVLLIPREPATKEVKIPVNISGATNIGSLHFELVFDATKLKITAVESSSLIGNSLIKYNTDAPERIVVGLVNSNGIRGDGPLIEVIFTIREKGSETIPLTFENVAAYDASTLNRLSLSTTNGSFKQKDNSFTPPTLSFAPSAK